MQGETQEDIRKVSSDDICGTNTHDGVAQISNSGHLTFGVVLVNRRLLSRVVWYMGYSGVVVSGAER
jgi:hypothetical protein